MSRDYSARVALALARHPYRCFVLALVLTLGAVAAIQRKLAIETDLTALLPRDSPVGAATREAIRDFGGFDFMYCVLEAEPGQGARLIEAAPRVAAALDDRQLFTEITWRHQPDRLDAVGVEGQVRILALLTEAEWNEIDRRVQPTEMARRVASIASLLNLPESSPVREAVVRDPLGILEALDDRREILRGPLKLNINNGHFLSADGSTLLILLKPRKPSTDLLFSADLKAFLDATREVLYERHPGWRGTIGIEFFGAPVEAIAEADQLRSDAKQTAALSTALILVLFLAVFRRPEALVFTLLPAGLAVLWTMGATALVVGRLTQVTATFAAILIGLGVDYSVHIYNRFLEEVRLGASLNDAVVTSLSATSASNAAATMTTALAFFAMTATSFLGFRELGLVLGMGTLMSLLASWLLMPGLLRALGRMELALVNRRPLPDFGLRRARFLVTAYPRVTLLGSLTIASFLALYARSIEFDPSFRNLRQGSRSYEQLRDRIESRFQSPGSQLIAISEGRSLDEALEENDRLYRNLVALRSAYPVLAIDSLRTVYPSPRTQERSLGRMAALGVGQIEAELDRIAREQGLDPAPFAHFIGRMRELQALARRLTDSKAPIVSFANVTDPTFEELVQSYVVHRTREGRYRVATQVYPRKGEWEAGVPEGFRDAMQEGLTHRLELTGLSIIWEELQRTVLRDLALIAVLSVGALALFLLLYFRSIREALLSALPVGIGTLCTLGLAEAVEIKLNYLNVIAFPIVIGIGIDAGFHLLHRFRELGGHDLRIPIERTGRAIVLSSLSTCFGFASLATAQFRSLREIGILILFGILSTLLSALVLLPAVLRLLVAERSEVFSGGRGDELG